MGKKLFLRRKKKWDNKSDSLTHDEEHLSSNA